MAMQGNVIVKEEEISAKGDASGGSALSRRLPVSQWIRSYSRQMAIGDAVAGVTLGLTLVPQSLAYASLASLPLHYGLYTAFLGSFVYALLGTVKEVSIGPTSVTALMTLSVTSHLPCEAVPLLSLLSGVIVLLMPLLKIDRLVNAISPAVVRGFTTGTAFVVGAVQLPAILGVKCSAETVPVLFEKLYLHIGDVRLNDTILSIVCCSILLALRKLKDVPVSPKRAKLKKALWLISISRNALVVTGASLLAYSLYRPHEEPFFQLSGRVASGLPPLALPWPWLRRGNETVGPVAVLQVVGPTAMVLPALLVVINIAIAKAFSAGKRVDASQEMVALGAANVLGAFVGAMPACGAFTRSAVSASSGVRTPAAGLYAGALTMLALSFMTDCFFFIPKACLASVLFCAVIFMMDISLFREWRAWGSACASCACSLLCSLVLIPLSVPLGVLVDSIALLFDLARVPLHSALIQLSDGSSAVRVDIGWCVLFVNASRVETLVLRHCQSATTTLVDLRRVNMMDHAALVIFKNLVEKFKAMNRELIFFGANADIKKKLSNIDWMNQKTLMTTNEVDAILAAKQKQTNGLTEVVNVTEKPLGSGNNNTEHVALLHQTT